jgi:3-methyladenine DNA glycosylase AlkC
MLSMLKYISIVQKPLILSKFRTLEGLKNDNSGQFINLNELSKLIKKIKKCFDTYERVEELKKNKFQLTQFSIMLDWLKNINKEHPEFWKNYVSKFDKKSTRFVVLSTETSE